MASKKILILLTTLIYFRAAPAGVSPPLVKTLENGLTVVTQRDEASEITVLEIVIKGGQLAEPAGREGLAYLATRFSMDIPDQSTAQAFMVKALHYNMSVRSDSAVIHLECLTEYFDQMLGTFLDVLTDPLFNNIRLDRITEYMEHQRRIQGDDAVNVGRLAHLETFFQGSGYAASIYGTEASLKAFKSKEAKEFYDRYFVANNMIVLTVSNLDDAEMQALLAKRFGKFRISKAGAVPAAPPLPTPRPPSQTPRIIEKETQQNFVGAAFALPAASPRNFILQMLVENIVGRGPGSRLWSLRTDQKLAYNVAAAATPMRYAGLLEAYLETSPEKAAGAQEALGRALLEFFEKGISAEDLETGKTELKALFLRANEVKSARVQTLGSLEALGLGAGLFAAFTDELKAVTLEEVNAFIRAVMKPEAASWVIVGPKSPK